MTLTSAQKAALKTAIQAQSDLNALYSDGNLSGLAALLNTDALPDFFVWRSLVTRDEIMENGFDWVRVDNLSVGKARIWDWLFSNGSQSINPTKPNVRAGIDETWKGTQADLDVRAAVYTHCRRLVSRVERVFVTGTGTTGTPGLLGVEGPIAFSDLIGL